MTIRFRAAALAAMVCLAGCASDRYQREVEAMPPDVQRVVIPKVRVAADTWLQKVDAGQYYQAYDETAGARKDAASRDKGAQILENMRPGGVSALKEREPRCVTYSPDFVSFCFNAYFENGANSGAEYVKLRRDSDGVWRVMFYSMNTHALY